MEFYRKLTPAELSTIPVEYGYKIPMFCGRPKRDTEISKDDINDLIILLNTTSSVKEFMKHKSFLNPDDYTKELGQF